MKTRIAHFNLLLLGLLALTLNFSCKKDDANPAKEFFSDNGHVFTYKLDGDDIVFNLDVLSDRTLGLLGTYPDIDIYRLYVDVDNNGVVDKDIDLMFSLGESGTCMVTLVDEFSTSACSYPETVNGTRSFGKTGNSSTPHTSFKVSIPKTMLSKSTKANVVVHLFDSATSWSYFPSGESLFDKTFELSL
ncbi:MAG: hypothetical protein IT258_01490 [Saprospiraceae bacterium]|nr:hypothetical protein [Saprospiraceae bacterium]